MNDRLTITLKVVGSELQLSIPRKEEEEELVRAAVRLINQKSSQYKEISCDHKKTDYDYLAMASVQIAREYLKMIKEKDISPFETAIKKMDKQLDSFLSKEFDV